MTFIFMFTSIYTWGTLRLYSVYNTVITLKSARPKRHWPGGRRLCRSIKNQCLLQNIIKSIAFLFLQKDGPVNCNQSTKNNYNTNSHKHFFRR